LSGDEIEDLVSVLADVKAHHPDVQGVSVGAILSNYQRVRVEHVCDRLGLTPLCYLWQRDQSELFSEMVQANMEAILIKVAGIGLTPKHLGKTLIQMQDTLMKLVWQRIEPFNETISLIDTSTRTLFTDPIFVGRAVNMKPLLWIALCSKTGSY